MILFIECREKDDFTRFVFIFTRTIDSDNFRMDNVTPGRGYHWAKSFFIGPLLYHEVHTLFRGTAYLAIALYILPIIGAENKPQEIGIQGMKRKRTLI